MSTYKVKMMQDGNFDVAVQIVEGRTEKEAAETLYGCRLFRQGPTERLRVMVQAPGENGNPTLFYER